MNTVLVSEMNTLGSLITPIAMFDDEEMIKLARFESAATQLFCTVNEHTSDFLISTLNILLTEHLEVRGMTLTDLYRLDDGGGGLDIFKKDTN